MFHYLFSHLQPDPHGKGKKMSVMIDQDEIEKERLKAAAEEMLVMDLIGRHIIMAIGQSFSTCSGESRVGSLERPPASHFYMSYKKETIWSLI